MPKGVIYSFIRGFSDKFMNLHQVQADILHRKCERWKERICLPVNCLLIRWEVSARVWPEPHRHSISECKPTVHSFHSSLISPETKCLSAACHSLRFIKSNSPSNVILATTLKQCVVTDMHNHRVLLLNKTDIDNYP